MNHFVEILNEKNNFFVLLGGSHYLVLICISFLMDRSYLEKNPGYSSFVDLDKKTL